MANSDSVGKKGSKWKMTIERGDKIALKGAYGKYLAAESNGKANANRAKADKWELFEPIGLGGDKYAFKTHHNTYLVAGNDKTFNANSVQPGDKETFEVFCHTSLEGAVALRDWNLARKFIRDFIDKGEDVNTADGSGRTHLYWAADLGYKDLVTQLINLGADVNLADKRKYTPLHRAAIKGHRDIAALLIDNSADVDSRDEWGYSPLHLAARDGHKKVAFLLIRRGADIEAKTDGGESPLDVAVRNGRDNVAALLRGEKKGQELSIMSLDVLSLPSKIEVVDIFHYSAVL